MECYCRKKFRSYKWKVIFTLFVVGFLILPALPLYAQSSNTQDSPKLFEINEGWEYRWGDSPLNEHGIPVWSYDSLNNPNWNKFDYPSEVPNIKELNNIWIRVKLPYGEWKDPCLIIRPDHQSLEVYLDNVRIYTFGKLESTYSKVNPYTKWHIVSLPENYQGKTLALRVKSPFKTLVGRFYKVKIGSRSDYLLSVISKSSDYEVLSVLSVFIGFVLIFIYFIRRREQKVFFSLGFASFCTGIWLFVEPNAAKQLYIDSPQLWYYISYISFYLLPSGYCAFVEQMFEGRYRIYLRCAWQFCIIAVVLNLVLDVTNVLSFVVVLKYFHMILILMILLIIATIVRGVREGNKEAKYFGIGITILSLFGVYDILGMYAIFLPWAPRNFVVHWGMFIFILILVFILGLRFSDVYDKLKIYSKEIQIKNDDLKKMWNEVNNSRDEIAEWNRTLENRVTERTEQLESTNLELEAANSELKNAFDTLQKTQEQLIHSEKMSALGYLMSGVAHEINTPVGVSVTAASYLLQETKELMSQFRNNMLRKSDLVRYLDTSLETSDMILMNLKRGSDLIRSFKQVATDQSTEEKRKFVLNQYINEVLLSLKPQLKRTKLSILVLCSDVIEIVSYPGAIAQVITNLIMNSLVHAYDVGSIGTMIIDVTLENNLLVMKYSDDGKGIDKNTMDKIFNPFFTTRRGSGGTGLGLSIVYNLVTKTLGGNISSESHVGKGTVFTISFSVEGVGISDKRI